MKTIVLSLAFLSLTSLGFAQKTKDFKAMLSLIKEAKEKGNLKKADSIAQDYLDNYLFNLNESELFTKENLDFVGEFFNNEKSRGFQLFMKEAEKINAVLGDYSAQGRIMDFIDRKYLPQGDFSKIKKPNWDSIEKKVIVEFGALGREIVYGQRMIYCLVNQDWKNYGIYFKKYFEIALKHSRYHANNMSWLVFENVNDLKILLTACEVMKYALENGDQNNVDAYDTYANLLYKTGNNNKAIEWEEKAVKLSNQGKVFVETLEKMKAGEKTWLSANP